MKNYCILFFSTSLCYASSADDESGKTSSSVINSGYHDASVSASSLELSSDAGFRSFMRVCDMSLVLFCVFVMSFFRYLICVFFSSSGSCIATVATWKWRQSSETALHSRCCAHVRHLIFMKYADSLGRFIIPATQHAHDFGQWRLLLRWSLDVAEHKRHSRLMCRRQSVALHSLEQ